MIRQGLTVAAHVRGLPWRRTGPRRARAASENLSFTGPPWVAPRIAGASLASGSLGDPLGSLQELVPRAQLHAGSPELLAGRPLELVDRRPARVGDQAHAAL